MNTDDDIFIVGRMRGGFDIARRVRYVDSVWIFMTGILNYYSQTIVITPCVVSIKRCRSFVFEMSDEMREDFTGP